MKISNSKKQLAKIIHENGGWRDGAESAWFQGQNAGKVCCEVWFGAYGAAPEFKAGVGFLSYFSKVIGRFPADKFDNWHQTILSRDEYFHLYPVAEAEPEPVAEAKPTIEQLAADYRNRKDYADRKQQEADAAKADADAKLAELVAAGKVLGLVLSVAESEVCDDGWVSYDGGGCPVDANEVVEVFLRKGRPSLDGPKAAHEWDWSIEDVDGDIVKCRRAKGDADA